MRYLTKRGLVGRVQTVITNPYQRLIGHVQSGSSSASNQCLLPYSESLCRSKGIIKAREHTALIGHPSAEGDHQSLANLRAI